MTKAEKRCEWLTDKYILCLLALFPLFTGFHGYANLTAAKFWLYTGATAAWLLGLLPCLCTGARLFAKKPGAFFYLTCAFLVWNLVSAALSPWREKTFLGAGRYDGLFTQFLYALTALGIAHWGRKKIIYVRVFGASVFLCCAVALWQIAGGNPLGLYPNGWRFADAGTLYSGMYLGTVGNTLILGSVLSLAVPVLVYTAVKKRGYDLLLLLPAAMALYVLPVPERVLVRVGRAAWLMRADAAEAHARTAAEVYSGGGGRFGADRAARSVFLSGAERDAV